MTITKFSRRAATVAAAVVAASTVSVIETAPAQAYSYWGAIAYSANGSYGRAWNYPTGPDAGAAAVDSCGYTDCKVLSQFPNCGAVAYDGHAYQGGTGPTLAAAQARALRLLGGGWIDSWLCN